MLIDYFLDGIAKTSVFGKYPDFGAKNRSISRKGSLNPFNGSDSKKLIEISDYRKKELNEIFNLRTEKRIKLLYHMLHSTGVLSISLFKGQIFIPL